MFRYEFQLRISADDYLDYYRGEVQHVLVRCTDGRTVQFPASRLQRFVTPAGIHGKFALICDADHKCIDLQRLEAGEES